MKLLRLYEDETGESHFVVIEYPMTLRDDSSLAKPHFFTEPETAKAWAYVLCPTEWDGGLHPTPCRQVIICTGGTIRVTSSLGDSPDLMPGSAVLLEDTRGKAHISEVTSSQPFEAMIIQLA